MRIAIIAPGSRGDVQPYVALGVGLQEAGHQVLLVTHEDLRPLVEPHGLQFWPVAGRVQDVAQSAAMRQLLEGGRFTRVLAEMAREAQRGALTFASAGLEACSEADLLLTGLGGLFVGLALAEALRRPLVQAYYIPFTPTRAYPSFLLPRLPTWMGGAANRASYLLARQMLWQAFRPADRLARREVLRIPPAPFWGAFGSPRSRECPILYGYSPHVLPPPSDWGSDVHVTGYWFLDEGDGWRPPSRLAEFLEAGPPPVYVGFGSMSSRDPVATARLVLDALAESGQRGVLLSGWGGLQADDLPPSVLAISSAPFGWLYPRMAAVVHHGGAGTTAEGLRAGVPAVVVPFFGDQPFWGQRVASLGVGPLPIPRRRLTAQALAQAISKAVNDPQLRQRAAELGARIRAEDGVANAVAVIQRLQG